MPLIGYQSIVTVMTARQENPWSYVFLSFFRDDVGAIRRELRKRKNGDLFWGNVELAVFATALFMMFLFNWRYVIFYFLPFWYLGHCFSYLNGYYRHYGANPDKPIAWGVSSYGKIYNWLFFCNGYHAEHHFRPKVHWTKMGNFIKPSNSCKNRKAFVQSSARTCLVFWIPICRNVVDLTARV